MRYSFRDLVIDSRTGLNPRKNFILGSGTNAYITIKDIFDGKINISDKTDRVDDDAIQIIKKRSRITVGDVLFVSIGRIGETAIVQAKDDTWDVNESVFVFTVNQTHIIPEYFCLLFQTESVRRFLNKNSSGSTFKSIKMNQLERMEFDIPSIEEQKYIVSTIDEVKRILSLRRQQLTELDTLIKARFVEMFEGKDYPQTTIGDLVWGKVSSAKKDFSQSDIIKYIDISSIDNERNTMTGYAEYVLSEAPSRAQQHIYKDDIVISTVRPNLRNVATTVFEDDNLVASSGFCVLRATKCLPKYLMAIVTSDKFTDDMTKVVTGANYPAIKDSDVLNYQVALPPLTIQNQFAAFVEQVDKSKAAVQKALDEAQMLFESLMQKYFG